MMTNELYKQIGKTVDNAVKNNGSLTDQNLKYVWRVAQSVNKQTGVDIWDLFTEGVIAMRKVEEKYDPTLNDNFVKYAGRSVRGYMLNFVNRQQSLVHIPVNHMQGYKAGQSATQDAQNVSYDRIDTYDFDTLGSVDSTVFQSDEFEVLENGLRKLDVNGQIAIKMKLRLDEYSDIKKNNMSDIAEVLEVPVSTANKIYKDALNKLSKYCQAELGR